MILLRLSCHFRKKSNEVTCMFMNEFLTLLGHVYLFWFTAEYPVGMRTGEVIRASVNSPKPNMASQSEGGGKDDIKTHFVTREGTYKLMPLSEYSKPTRVPYNGQANTPVKVSFINVNDGSGSPDRICFNVGRELYFYVYKGVKKVCSIHLPRSSHINV